MDEIRRGEVFFADLSPVVGSEQGGIRPVLIVQNDVGNRHSPTVIAAAITSRRDKTALPTHITVGAEHCGLQKDSIILLEQVRTAARTAGIATVDGKFIEKTMAQSLRRFDKGGDAFYDQISALHKSVRGSNPDAALYWLTRMLDGGADARPYGSDCTEG